MVLPAVFPDGPKLLRKDILQLPRQLRSLDRRSRLHIGRSCSFTACHTLGMRTRTSLAQGNYASVGFESNCFKLPEITAALTIYDRAKNSKKIFCVARILCSPSLSSSVGPVLASSQDRPNLGSQCIFVLNKLKGSNLMFRQFLHCIISILLMLALAGFQVIGADIF